MYKTNSSKKPKQKKSCIKVKKSTPVIKWEETVDMSIVHNNVIKCRDVDDVQRNKNCYTASGKE